VVHTTLTMEWDRYEIYHPGISAPASTLPRAVARRAFDRFISERSARIEMLRRLLEANTVELSSSDDGIQALNDWFKANVEADPANPGYLLPEWYSVVNDISAFLGDVIIERCPSLHWEFFKWGKKNVAYQQPVIMGFRGVPNPKFNIDVQRRVAGYGHSIIARRGSVTHHGTVTIRGVNIDVDAAAARARAQDPDVEDDAFLRMLKVAESRA